MSEFTLKNEDPETLTTSTASGAVQHFSSVSAGAGATKFEVNAEGLFMGADNFNDAPFKITYAGDLTATSGSLTGMIIKGGKTAYTDDTNAGFWLGLVSTTPKLNIGASATKYLHYDGTDITILGGTITGGTIQTAATGYRVKMNGATSKLECLSGNTVLGSVYADANGDINLNGTDDVNLAIGGTIKCYASSTSFKPNSDRAYNLGADDAQWNDVYADRYFAGSSGTGGLEGPSTYGFLTALQLSGDPGEVCADGKYREITIIGGIITAVSSETSWTPLDCASGI